MKVSLITVKRTKLLIRLLLIATWPILAQTQTKSASADSTVSAYQRHINPTQQCAYLLHLPILKTSLISGPSPSDPNYVAMPELLLNNHIEDVRVWHDKDPICPLSLQTPAPPLPFQLVVTPSQGAALSGKPNLKGNYLSANWPLGPYRIYSIHYSIAPKNLRLYSHVSTATIPGTTENNLYDAGSLLPNQVNPVSGPLHYTVTYYDGALEFNTILYSKNGSVMNSSDTFVEFNMMTLVEAKKMLQSGVGLDQTIAVPASSTYKLHSIVTDPVSKRRSEFELTLDTASQSSQEVSK